MRLRLLKNREKNREKSIISSQLGVKYLGDNAINVVLLPIFKEMAQNLEQLASQSKNAISHMQITRCQLALTVGTTPTRLNMHTMFIMIFMSVTRTWKGDHG